MMTLELQAFEASALASPGPLQGWRFNRGKTNARA